jgi:hypothetical protein
MCPVCGNSDAKVLVFARRKGSAERCFDVFCPTCPVPFEIPGLARDVFVLDSRAREERRRRWALQLQEATRRGEALVHLS